MQPTLSQEEIGALLGADLADSFGVLGMHRVQLQGKDALVVRTFLPDAREVVVIGKDGGEESFAATRVCEEGVFEAVIPGEGELFPYEGKGGRADSAIRTLSGRSWEGTISICSTRGRTSTFLKSWERICARSMGQKGFISPSGRPAPGE